MKKSALLCLFIITALVLVGCTAAVNTGNNLVDTNSGIVGFASIDLKNQSNDLDVVDFGLDVVKDSDEVTVIVNLGDGVVHSYLDENSALSVAEYVTSERGQALIADMRAEQEEYLVQLFNSGMDFEMHSVYTTLLNGFALNIRYGDIEIVERICGKDTVSVSEVYNAPTYSVDYEALFSEEGVFANETGYNGEGMVIAIVDTAIDDRHDVFQTMPSNPMMTRENIEDILSALAINDDYWITVNPKTGELEYTPRPYTFTADDVYASAKVPFAFDYANGYQDILERGQVNFARPQDYDTSQYHGTHVSGIAVGNNGAQFKSAASEAQLVAMKVFEDGSQGATVATIINALSDALILGVDGINLSLGTAGGFTVDRAQTGYGEFMELAARCGITVCCATGNDNVSSYDPNYRTTQLTSNPDNGIVASPASFNNLGIGSIDNNTYYHVFAGEKRINLNAAVTDLSLSTDPLAFLNGEQDGEFEFVVVPGVGEAKDYEGLDLKGKIALVKRGTLSFTQKAQNAEKAGAVAILVYNHEEGIINPQLEAECIPVMSISKSDGLYLIENQGTKLSFSREYRGYNVSVFSSKGALENLDLGVDLLGVGGNVLSAADTQVASGATNGYTVLSGTSMASPNTVSAMVALKGKLRQQFPGLTTNQIRILANKIAMSSAEIVRDPDGNVVSPRAQGAGLMNLNYAVAAEAYLEVTGREYTKLNLGSDIKKEGIYTLSFNLVNMSEKVLSYDVSAIALTEIAEGRYMTGNSMALGFDYKVALNGKAVDGTVISVEAGHQAKIKIVITLDEEAKAYMDETYENGIYVDGFGILESLDGGVDLSIPFIAFYGDWYQAPVFEPSMIESDREIQDLPVFIQSGSYQIPGTYFASLQTRTQLEEINPYNITFKYYDAIAAIYIPTLRNASSLSLELYDEVTGDVYAYGDFTNVTKSYWYYGQQYVCVQLNLGDASFIFNNESWLNNSTLVFKFTAQFNGQGHYETYIPFRLDYEPPILEAVTQVEENGRTYLDLEVYDNTAVNYIGVYTRDDLGEPVQIGKIEKPISVNDLYQQVKNFNANEVNSIRFDVTDYLPYANDGKIMLAIVDFARNEVGYELFYGDEAAGENAIVNNNQSSSFSYNITGEGVQSFNNLTYSIYNVDKNEKQADRVRLLGESSGEDFLINKGILEAYTGNGGNIVIPEGVTKIAPYVFYENDTITGVTLPEGLVEIGEYNFYLMPNVEFIRLPSTLTTLGMCCFVQMMKCTDINIGDTQVSYYGGSFIGVGLDGDVVLPDPNGKQIEVMESFMGIPYVDSVVVKANVKNLYLSFLYGFEMKSIVFEKDISKFDYQSVGSFLECHALETITFKGNIIQFGKQINYETTQDVSFTGFGLKSLRAVYFEGYVLALYGMGFSQCPNLETVMFGSSLGEFNTMTFSQSKKLTRFSVTEDNKSLVVDEETGVMYNTAKTQMFISPNWDYEGEFVVPTTVNVLSNGQFCPGFGGVDSYNATWKVNEDGTIQMGIEFMSAASLTINGMTKNTTLKKVTLHSGITVLPAMCFANCWALEEVNTENIRTFNNYAFYESGLKEFVATETNRDFRARVFKDCRNMTKLEFHDNCTFQSGYNSYWFYSGLTSIKEITVPKNFYFNGVETFSFSTSLERVINKSTRSTSFGQAAFYGCSSLVEVTGFERVTSIQGTGAFAYCTALEEIYLPGVTSVYYSAFEGCTSLERYTFSDNLSMIYDGAFYNCVNLKEIKLGAKTNVSNFALTFYGCTSVEKIDVNEKNPYFVLNEGVLYSKNMTTLYLCATTNPTEHFVIPKTVTTIIAGAFKNSQNIKVLELGNVKNIPDELFMDSNIETVIGTPVVVGASAFKNTNLANIDLSQVTTVYNYAFENTKLTEVDLSSLNQGVGFGAFKNNEELQKIIIGERTGYFYLPFTFANCPNVTDIQLDANNRSFVIENDTLYDYSKTSVLKYFGNEEVVTVREGVKKIFIGAYQGNEAIKEVVLPSTLRYIGDAAFYGCTNLEKITFKSAKAPILESSYSETRLLTYNNFVDYADAIDNTTIAIYTPDDASYSTYIWRMYFANRYLLP